MRMLMRANEVNVLWKRVGVGGGKCSPDDAQSRQCFLSGLTKNNIMFRGALSTEPDLRFGRISGQLIVSASVPCLCGKSTVGSDSRGHISTVSQLRYFRQGQSCGMQLTQYPSLSFHTLCSKQRC